MGMMTKSWRNPEVSPTISQRAVSYSVVELGQIKLENKPLHNRVDQFEKPCVAKSGYIEVNEDCRLYKKVAMTHIP